MKLNIASLFLLLSLNSLSQKTIEWDGIYQLQLSDFQSPESQIGDVDVVSLMTASAIDFSYYMSQAEFMFTKNFNAKVNCTFKRDAAVLVAPDSSTAMDLLNFAQYEFDLSELYARKFRQRLFGKKDAFSDANFFKPVFDEIQRDLNNEHALAGKLTDLGRNREKLLELRKEVSLQISQLAEFCKTCKPAKTKKGK